MTSSIKDQPVHLYYNPDKFDEAKCLHILALPDEEREFKGVELLEVTPVTKAAPLMLIALEAVYEAMDIYQAPEHIVDIVEKAIVAAKPDDATDGLR